MEDVTTRDQMRAFQSPIKGEEIMKEFDLKPSRKIGDIKKMIEEAILDGVIENNHEEAYQYLMKIKDQFIN